MDTVYSCIHSSFVRLVDNNIIAVNVLDITKGKHLQCKNRCIYVKSCEYRQFSTDTCGVFIL